VRSRADVVPGRGFRRAAPWLVSGRRSCARPRRRRVGPNSVLRRKDLPKDVLVIGGGIAGIQASLDLAEMGIPVHLVERSPSIGGVMAQLDKTFPTNDCSI
jgi:heterodisulfide reductase subunit A-like polyferredoxin